MAGAIASRLHRYSAMRRYFALATVTAAPTTGMRRLELGIAASLSGRHDLATRSLRRAVQLAHSDPIVRQVAQTFQAGQPIRIGRHER